MAYDLRATLKLADEFTGPMRNAVRAFDDLQRNMQATDQLWGTIENSAQHAANQISQFATQTQQSVSQTDALSGQLSQAALSAEDLSDAGNTAGGNLTNAGNTGEAAGNKISSAFKKAAGIIASVIALDQIKDLGVSMIEAAGGAQAMEAQFSEVFKGMEDEASSKLTDISGEATILENRMKGSFTKIAAFAKTGGMDTAQSLDLADRSMRAVADSAAFYDRSLEDTTESLQSFLKGKLVAPRRCEAT